MPIMRKLVKLAIGYAVTKALARSGGPKGLLNNVLASVGRPSGHDNRTNRGLSRTAGQKRADVSRRSH